MDREKLRGEFAAKLPTTGTIFSEEASKSLLESYGVPSTTPYPAGTAEEAVTIGRKIGFPVVLKIWSPEITHKTDVGGVMLDLGDEEMVSTAFDRIIRNAKEKAPHARIDGVTVQRMARTKDALEMILGIKRDPIFGTVILAGMGGTGAELFADRALGFPPLNERLARLMLESLKIYPLLTGYRGSRPKNVERLIAVLIRLSYLAADYPEVKELDINPLVVTPEDVLALDARVVIDKETTFHSETRYAHLALHPYPEEYVKLARLPDGSSVTFRPIKPEDEPLWFDLLRSCSQESLFHRFRYFFHWETHEVASRYCYIDYDREVAIVAEVLEEGKRKIIGVGRLIADPDHESVEYAILIADAWQNRELGTALTDFCLDIAKKWNLKRVVAQTTTDNRRMVALFKKRDFEMKIEDTMVYVSKDL